MVMKPVGGMAVGLSLVMIQLVSIPMPAFAQTAPSKSEIASYRGLHQAAHEGNVAAIRKLASEGADLEARDGAGRTPLHVAAFASQDEAVRALAEAGADLECAGKPGL
jgi:hypothetical protein